MVARVSGKSRAILGAERTALNFLQHLSGIATLTASFVYAVCGTSARIYDERPTHKAPVQQVTAEEARERLAAMRKKMRHKIKLSIVDLKTEAGQPSGTKPWQLQQGQE